MTTSLKTVFLKKKRPSKSRLAALPFVAPRNKITNTRFWDVPAVGGYMGGCHTGEAMALSFLKYQRGELSGGPNSNLNDIVKSFAMRLQEEGGLEMLARPCFERTPAFDSLHGQSVGFFNTLSTWIENASKALGSRLDSLSDDELLKRMNDGLNFDADAYFKSLEPASLGNGEA